MALAPNRGCCLAKVPAICGSRISGATSVPSHVVVAGTASCTRSTTYSPCASRHGWAPRSTRAAESRAPPRPRGRERPVARIPLGGVLLDGAHGRRTGSECGYQSVGLEETAQGGGQRFGASGIEEEPRHAV